ncbi:MAG TPA: PAS domain S-box protein, partial [Fibrobacteria bacterium]|nr:PAS domain S-box protein [Fibrobacteria bacterium]
MHPEFSIRISAPARLEALAALGLSDGQVPEEIARVVRMASRSLGAASAAFLLLGEKGFSPRGSTGLPEALSARAVWPWEWSFLLEAAFKGTAVVTGTAGQDSAPIGAAGLAVDGFPADSLPAFLGAPVEDGNGLCLGVLALWDGKPREWTSAETGAIGDFAATLRDLLAGRAAVLRREAALRERAKAEEAFAAFRGEIDIILKTLDTPVIAFNRQGLTVFANAAAAALLGYRDAEELLHSKLTDISSRFDVLDEFLRPYPQDRLPSLRALRGEAVAGELICYRIKATGEERCSLVNATPVFDDQGSVRLVINVFNDITALKQAQGEIQKSRNQHLRYLEGLNQVSGAIEKTLDVERVLPAAMAKLLEVFECDRAWLIHPGEPEAGFRIPFSAERGAIASAGMEAIPAEAGFEAIVHACKATEDPVVFGRDLPLPNPEYWKSSLGVGCAKAISVRPQVGGPWILCLLRPPEAAPWKAEDFTMFKDISSRIATSLGAMLLHRDMRRSEEKYRTLFERSLDGIFRCAPDGVLLDANPALVAMLGYPDRAQLVGTLNRRLLPAGGDPHGISDHGDTFSVELPRLDGTPVWVEVN